jgi:hypothetical protein
MVQRRNSKCCKNISKVKNNIISIDSIDDSIINEHLYAKFTGRRFINKNKWRT